MKKALVITVLAALLIVPLAEVRSFTSATAQTYLFTHSGSPWATMGLAALGANNIPSSHLKTVSGNSAIDLAAPILAITALGENPRTFASTDLVMTLKNYHTGGQIGDTALLNDDIFGILALISAGENKTTSVIADSKNFLLSAQNPDGGWGFAASASSDTNTAAAAILALLSAGQDKNTGAIQNALTYLAAAQNSDGGFPYDPRSSFGTSSDSSSTAWVIWALNALGMDPASWSKAGGNPASFLNSTQNPQGFFEYQAGSGEDAFSPVTTAYAAIALSGRTLPLKILTTGGQAEFVFRIQGSAATICEGQAPGPTALDIVKNASQICGFTYEIQTTGLGEYLKKINSDEATGVIGWLYMVNNLLPGVGAGQYQLAAGDMVLWYYGEAGKPPASQSNSVNLSANIAEGGVGGALISFSVSPSGIDFGTLKKGESRSRALELKNTGTVKLAIEALVSGDQLYRERLQIDSYSWQQFSAELGAAQTQTAQTSISVPAGYAGSTGGKTGTLIFWAIAK